MQQTMIIYLLAAFVLGGVSGYIYGADSAAFIIDACETRHKQQCHLIALPVGE